ncbi:MAG: nucleotidyltransferase domain-containing protein [Candidatus Cloacimonetes bacterium]|nr:nucleotidyltransferase domain-containing protein [Candidatus Cloacimonadota bacterium]
MNRNNILQKIKTNICKDYPDAKIILYGSRARGDYQKYSDWDFLIIINQAISEQQKLNI